MARTKGATGKGLRYRLNQIKRNLLRKAKTPASLEDLRRVTSNYEKLITEAVLLTDPKDTEAIRKLSEGLQALTRANAAIGRMQRANELQEQAKLVSRTLRTIIKSADYSGVTIQNETEE